MRAANSGRRVGYDRPPTAPTVLFRLTGGAVVLGALLFAILPSASSARLSFYYAVEGVFRSTYAAIPLESATTTPVRPPPPGFAPVGIASGRLVGPWVVHWTEIGSGSHPLEPCQGASTVTSGSLSIGFRSPVSIDRFEILAGLDHANPRWASFERPATMDLLFSDGSCQRIRLADQYTDQQFAVHVAGVTGVTINVVSSYPPETSDARLLAISSVSFMHRR